MSSVKKLSLKKLSEFNTVWHEDSGLVFKSQKEIVVVGKLVDKKIEPLTDADITTCEKYKFKYEIAAVSEEDEETEEVEEPAEEVEEPSEEEEISGAEIAGEEISGEEVTEDDEVDVVDKEDVIKPKEFISEIVAEVVELPDLDNSFSKTMGELNRIWNSTNQQNSNKIHDLEVEIQTTRDELAALQHLYDNMKVKFDGIKQLFSL